MDNSPINQFNLTALLHKVDLLRYTPSGIPVLEVVLKHESWQMENDLKYLVKFELPAKIIGQDAELWQHKQGTNVQVSGFLAQRSQKIIRPVLRIQSITEIS